MKKNVSGQVIGAQLCSASDGSNFTGTVTVYVTGNGGTQALGSVGSGVCTHEGNGFHTYAPSQAETDYDHIAFTFVGSGAISSTVQVYPTFPQTGDSFGRLGAPAGASVSADVAAAKVDTAAIKIKTDFLPSVVAGAAGGLFIAGSNAATSIATALTANLVGTLTGNITGNLSGSVGSVSGAVGSVAGNVGGNVAGSVGSVATGGITAGSIAADAIGASELAADAVTEIATGVWAAATRELTAGTNIVLAKGTGITGFNDLSAATVNAEVDTAISDANLATAANLAVVAGYLDTEIAAIKAKTDNLPASPAATSDIPTAAAVADAVWDEAISGHLTAGTTGEAVANSSVVAAKLNTTLTAAAGSPGEYQFTSDALELAPVSAGGGSAPSAAAVAAAVWAEALPGSYGAGAAGKILGDNLNATVASRASQASLDVVDGIVDAILVDTAEIGAAGAGLTALATAANLAVVAGYLDTEIAAIKTKTDALPANPAATTDIPSAAAVADAVWAEALPGAYGAGAAGKILGDNLNATVTSRASQASLDVVDGVVDAILVDTAEIGAAGAGLTALATAANLAVVAGYIDTEVAAIKAKTDNLPANPAATGDIPSATAVAGAVWDEAAASHLSAGSFGLALRDADLRGSRTTIRGTVGSATTPTTTQFTPSAIDPSGAATDQFKGRIIVFDNDTATPALRGQATDVTSSTNASLPLLTFTALSTAPSSGDTFSVL